MRQVSNVAQRAMQDRSPESTLSQWVCGAMQMAHGQHIELSFWLVIEVQLLTTHQLKSYDLCIIVDSKVLTTTALGCERAEEVSMYAFLANSC